MQARERNRVGNSDTVTKGQGVKDLKREERKDRQRGKDDNQAEKVGGILQATILNCDVVAKEPLKSLR